MFFETKAVKAKNLAVGDILILDVEDREIIPIDMVYQIKGNVYFHAGDHFVTEDSDNYENILDIRVKKDGEFDKEIDHNISAKRSYAHSCDCPCLDCVIDRENENSYHKISALDQIKILAETNQDLRSKLENLEYKFDLGMEDEQSAVGIYAAAEIRILKGIIEDLRSEIKTSKEINQGLRSKIDNLEFLVSQNLIPEKINQDLRSKIKFLEIENSRLMNLDLSDEKIYRF